ncbi:MAG: hypothetical protein LW850_33970 [Planctomycetaceae bacterium]|jgi:hypothetical protein|nr:hypothetical protein [Planctomycetaceae bacterium]
MSYRKWAFRVGGLLGVVGVCGLGVFAGIAWSQAERQKFSQRTMPSQPFTPVATGPLAQGYAPIIGPDGYVVQRPVMGGGPPQGQGMGGGPPGMGGMMGGGPGMGGGRIEGSIGGMVSADSAVIWWGKPKGDEPGWLSRGKQAMKAEETLRETLDKEIEVSISSAELLQALEIILGQHWIPYTANQAGMDAPVVMLESKGKVRDVLRRVLRPMQLDYVIHQDSLQIVNPREDQFQRTIRVYDLAHVISNSQDMGKVLQLIESTVQPDQWHTQGGQSRLESVGSVLAVASTELVHEEVETLLSKLESLGMHSKAGAQGQNPRGLMPASTVPNAGSPRMAPVASGPNLMMVPGAGQLVPYEGGPMILPGSKDKVTTPILSIEPKVASPAEIPNEDDK